MNNVQSRLRKKHRSKKLFILIGFVLVLCTSIASYFIFFQAKETVKPDQLLIQYMSNIEKQDYHAMYNMLSTESKAAISEEDYINRNRKIYEGIEAKNIDIQIKKTTELKDHEEVNYQIKMDTIAGTISFPNTMIFIKDDQGNYRLKWKSEDIFPKLSADDRVSITTIPSRRGAILDRNHLELALDGTASSVGLVPGKMAEPKEADIAKISEILDISEEAIQQKLTASYVTPDTFVPIKMIATDNLQAEELLLQIPGVKITNAPARIYPFGIQAAHLTGYVKEISAEELKELEGQDYQVDSIIGKIGLEKLYEDRLRGIDGCEIEIMDKSGNLKEIIQKKEAKNGEDIKLTIDSTIQSQIYDQLKDDKSSTVVMNPRTGEILALVSTPAYDPNEFVMGISEAKWQSLNDNPTKPLYNRFKAALSPGSSFKPIVAAIGITTGKLDPLDNFGHSGRSWQKDESWGNYKITTIVDYGDQVNLANALLYSDNIYFGKAVLKIGAETLSEQLTALGFGETIPFTFGLTPSQFASDGQFATEIQLADSGYGQGQVLVNPIHMASIYSAFVNNGNLIKPILEYHDQVTPEIWKANVFSSEAVKTVCDDLVQVIENPNGTGHSGKIDGLTIAGKTGTAEIKAAKEDTTGTELGWFNAFTVDRNSEKQYLVISMVEDVKNRGGSHYVIPTVKAIFEE